MMTNDVAEQTLNFGIKFRSLFGLVVTTSVTVTFVGQFVRVVASGEVTSNTVSVSLQLVVATSTRVATVVTAVVVVTLLYLIDKFGIRRGFRLLLDLIDLANGGLLLGQHLELGSMFHCVYERWN